MANIRCAEIASDQLQALLRDQAWTSLQREAAAGLVSDFGGRSSALLNGCLTGAAAEAMLTRFMPVAVTAIVLWLRCHLSS